MELGPKQKKWIKALRSGKYKQGKYHLCVDNEYCCLGIANEVLDLGINPRCGGLRDDQHEAYTKLGLRDSLGGLSQVISHDDQRWGTLSGMNDQEVPFNEIADAIEANPELVFTHAC